MLLRRPSLLHINAYCCLDLTMLGVMSPIGLPAAHRTVSLSIAYTVAKVGAGHVLSDALPSARTALQRSSTHPRYQTMSDRGRSMTVAQTHGSAPGHARALEGALVVPLEFIERDP